MEYLINRIQMVEKEILIMGIYKLKREIWIDIWGFKNILERVSIIYALLLHNNDSCYTRKMHLKLFL